MGINLDAICGLVVDGTTIDATSVADNAPEAVTDWGGNGWPILFDDRRLIPRLVLAVQELAAQ